MCQKVAMALLARPALLVLDEAWTGLDQAARGALDVAVRERLAQGGTVLFVDHDPARLAGRVDERWRLAAGTVTVTRGAVAASGRNPGPDASGIVIIEVAGLETASVAEVARLPGVLSVDADQASVHADPLRVSVLAAQSDGVLRRLLSWDGVHIRAVHRGPEAVRPAPEAVRPAPEAVHPEPGEGQ
jgi:ABC-2 type transport system ATP-binding protein